MKGNKAKKGVQGLPDPKKPCLLTLNFLFWPTNYWAGLPVSINYKGTGLHLTLTEKILGKTLGHLLQHYIQSFKDLPKSFQLKSAQQADYEEKQVPGTATEGFSDIPGSTW